MSRMLSGVVLVSALLIGGATASAQSQESPAKGTAQADAPEPNPKGKPAPNSVFLEGMGAGLYYSVNYERRVIDDLGVRLGFSYLSLTASASAGGTSASTSTSYMTIPMTASYLGVRGRKSGLELGGGVTLAYTSGASSSGVSSVEGSGMNGIGTMMVGYRLHPVDHAGFQFRVGVMALAAKGLSLSNPHPDNFGVLPWFYLSGGAGF